MTFDLWFFECWAVFAIVISSISVCDYFRENCFQILNLLRPKIGPNWSKIIKPKPKTTLVFVILGQFGPILGQALKKSRYEKHFL